MVLGAMRLHFAADEHEASSVLVGESVGRGVDTREVFAGYGDNKPKRAPFPNRTMTPMDTSKLHC